MDIAAIPDQVIETAYDPSRMQDKLFIIPSFPFLRNEIEELVKKLGIRNEGESPNGSR